MKVPGIGKAVVDDRKLIEYLLAEGHPAGRAKARFFRSLGFSKETAGELRTALVAHANDNEISSSIETRFGSKYVIDGSLRGPTGDVATVRAVWFIETGERHPRFVTAYPLREAK